MSGAYHPRPLAAAALVAVAAALPAPSASATGPDVVAFSAAGERLAPGSVVARGVPAGDGACSFPDPVEVSVATPGAAVTLRPAADCSLVVSGMSSAGAFDTRRLPRGVFLPGPDVDTSQAQADDVSLRDTTAAAATALTEPIEKRVGGVWQNVVDGNGRWQAGGYREALFDRGAHSGELRNPAVSPWSRCDADAHPLVVGGVPDLVTTRAVSCTSSLGQRGPDRVDVRGFGVYERRLLDVRLLQFRMDEKLAIIANGQVLPTCSLTVISGAWPADWSTECVAGEWEGVE